MARVYDFLGRPYPGEKLVSKFHRRSVGKGGGISIHPDIEALCDGLLNRLNARFEAGSKGVESVGVCPDGGEGSRPSA